MREGNPRNPATHGQGCKLHSTSGLRDGRLQTKGRMPAAEGDSLLGVSALA